MQEKIHTMLGHVNVHNHEVIRIHDYMAPSDGLLVHSVIVEGPNSLVLFDAQFLLSYAKDLADYIQRLGKPLARIIISHVHPDHWSGLAVVAPRFPAAKIAALPKVRDYIALNGQEIMDARRNVFGDAVASQAVIPEEIIEPGEHVIDGVHYQFEAHDEGESQYQLVAILPNQRTLLAFDLVFPRHVHAFTVAPYFSHWTKILRQLESYDFDAILVGHSRPASREDIGATIEYLEIAKEIHAQTTSPEDYAAKLKKHFPDRGEAGWIDFASLMLYGVINP